ncbi:MAG TPA: 50S ribosomal protein L3 [Candidatus Peribacterales bacterium]|nr:50S ribosomal protein L3 [Candidatus Peribacterales bacterium]
MLGLITTKIGMSRVFQEDGTVVPVTYLKVDPNTVVRHRMKDRDGYDALVLGIQGKKWKTRKGKEHTRFACEREFQVPSLEGYEVGKTLTAELIPPESMVSVVGVSKGKGFAGVIKRYNFSAGPWTHGSHQHREPGSVGCRAKPGRVQSGKKLPGRMGSDQITLHNCSVVISDPAENVIAVKGPVPGPNGSTVIINIESLPEQK